MRVLADVADQVAPSLLARFRDVHPGVSLRVRESDLADPSAGLSADLGDVALTRSPLDGAGIATLVLGAQPIGVVVRHDDPIAGAAAVLVSDLDGRGWLRLAQAAGPAWCSYWSGARSDQDRRGPEVRAIEECLQGVLWGDLSPSHRRGSSCPQGWSLCPTTDREPNRVLLAWRTGRVSKAGPRVDHGCHRSRRPGGMLGL